MNHFNQVGSSCLRPAPQMGEIDFEESEIVRYVVEANEEILKIRARRTGIN